MNSIARRTVMVAIFAAVALLSFFLGAAIDVPLQSASAGSAAAPALVTPTKTATRTKIPTRTSTITKRMNAAQVDNLFAARTPVPGRLVPLDGSAKFPLEVLPQGQGSGLNADKVDGLESSSLQRRVTGTCAVGSVIGEIKADGSVTCGPSVDFAGSGTASTAARSDHGHTDYVAKSGDTMTGNLILQGSIMQPETANGIVKAGVVTRCMPDADKTIIRQFNSVNNAVFTVNEYGPSGMTGQCVIDFGFDLTDRYIVVTAVGDGNNPEGIGAHVVGVSGSTARFYRYRISNNAYGYDGLISVLVF